METKYYKMKTLKILLALTVAFLFSQINNVNAQISVKDSKMSLGNKPAFIVDISGADKKMAEKKWKEFLKDYGKVDRNRKAKEWSTMQARIPIIDGPSAVNLFLKLEEGKDMTRALIFVDDGTKFISDDDAEAASVQDFVREYVTVVDKEVAKKYMEQGEKDLKGFNKDLGKLEKTNGKLHKDIEDYKKKIEEAEAKIRQNLLDQDAAKETIEGQKQKVQELTDHYNSIGKG